MSYDISIKSIGEVEVYEDNYTYNVSPMFRKALGGDDINELHGKSTIDCLPKLNDAIKNMQESPEVYEAMNPTNKWGNYEGALNVLHKLRNACEENIDGVIYIS